MEPKYVMFVYENPNLKSSVKSMSGIKPLSVKSMSGIKPLSVKSSIVPSVKVKKPVKAKK